MIKKWIEKKIEARVNEYLANLEYDVLGSYVEVEPAMLPLVAKHIEVSDLIEHIDVDDSINDALDYDRIADYVDMNNLSDHICMHTLADRIEAGDIASAFSESEIAGHISVDAKAVSDHIDMDDLADYVAEAYEFADRVAKADNFVAMVSDTMQESVLNAVVDRVQESTDLNTHKVNAVIDALYRLEDAFAMTELRWALGEGEQE